jgi:polyisoprenoid-binding protein YceI
MSTATDTRAYTIDASHSAAHFSVRHLMISKVRGTFKTLSGTIALPAGGGIPTSIDVSIDAASIDTRDAQRDGHLKSPDFFDVEKYPTITFKSTSITPTDATHFDVTGDLTIHGTTQSVTFSAELTGQGKDPWGNDRVGYEAAHKVNRKDFGLVWNQALEAGGVAIGDQVDITLDVEAIPTPA